MKRKVLFLTLCFDTGGTEKATFDIITHLNPEKYDITLMSMYGWGYFWDNLPSYVHKKCFFSRYIRGAIRFINHAPAWLVYRMFIHDKYDVEIACGDNHPSYVINASPNKHSIKIAWIHMDVIARGYRGWGMRTAWGRAHFYNHFDHIVNVSQECERKFQERFGTYLPTCVIYNLIDTDFIQKKASQKPDYVLPEGRFNIVCIGRLASQKGFDRLIEAYHHLKEKYTLPPCRITILGREQDQTFAKLNATIQSYHLEDEIVLAGYFDNPYAILKQADLFLLSSRDESFALVVGEAMALNVPVMATRCTGPVELLENGQKGLLAENSTQGIEDGLKKILLEPDTMNWLRSIDNSRRFDWHQQVHQIEALLDEPLH